MPRLSLKATIEDRRRTEDLCLRHSPPEEEVIHNKPRVENLLCSSVERKTEATVLAQLAYLRDTLKLNVLKN